MGFERASKGMGFPTIMAVIQPKYRGNPALKMPAEDFFRKVLVSPRMSYQWF
jgi:hypothetical protein